MPIIPGARICLACLAAHLSLSGQSHAALPEPRQPDESYNWYNGNTWVNSAYALGVSHWNILRYYDESRLRYGALPPADQLTDSTVGWDVYLASNIPGLGKFIRDNNPADNGGGWTIATPEIPLVNRVVTPVNKIDGFRKPLLPPMRLTRDGRIGVVPGSGSLDGNPQPLRIRLNRPEVLGRHFLESAPGVPTLDPETWEVADYNKWGMPGAKATHFVSICEAAPAKNPYSCGSDDCYDLTLIGSGVKNGFTTSDMLELPGGFRTKYMPQLESEDRLYSRAMTIRVSAPKTAQARIASVDFSADYKVSPVRQGVLFELNTPGDGRLLVTRRQGLPLIWRHTTTGQMRAGSYETVYAVAPESAAPCDVTQWGDLYPISHAPFDPRVKNKYPFAKYRFRDPMGNYIPDGADIKGTYPWVDMDAKNISLMISDANLFRDGLLLDNSRFSSRCVHSGCTPSDSPDKSNISQFTLMGAWTKGKMSIFDNRLNYADFRINLANALNLDLYQPGSALPSTTIKSASVEVGAYREVGSGSIKDQYIALKDEYGNPVRGRDGVEQKYLMKNSSLFDSIENRMNYNPHMKPAAPHDVVWMLSSGATSDEFSFDDLLNNNAFIISDMVAAYSWANSNRFRMTGYDGWNELWGSWRGQVKVQNAATTLPDRWLVPHSGDVVHGRIEPVGNGGIKGKGMYFNGENTRIRYDIPAGQPQAMSESYWFHSLFLDARSLDTYAERVIVDFPDRSRLTMKAAGDNVSFNAYNNYGEREQVFLVPSILVKERWFHLGIQKSPANLITVFVNGYPYTEFPSTSGSMFRMTNGALVLGRAHNSYDRRYDSLIDQMLGLSTIAPANYQVFKGWMDEYKVFSYRPDLETVCNLAHGTLVATGSSTPMILQAALYPSYMHDRVSTALQLRGQPTHSRYACYMGSPNQDKTAVLHRLPANSVSIRAAMHFPEGPLFHDAPRPDSTSNEFCLACHSGNESGGLTVEALRYSNLPAKLDPRRQPTQAPPFITGNISAEFVNSIKGNWAAAGSRLIDEYLLPSSSGLPPDIRNLVQVRNGQPVSVVNSGSTLARNNFSALRVNASGLTARAVFHVNGAMKLDDRIAPFELPAGSLVNGGNQVLVTTYASSGLNSQRSYSITINP